MWKSRNPKIELIASNSNCAKVHFYYECLPVMRGGFWEAISTIGVCHAARKALATRKDRQPVWCLAEGETIAVTSISGIFYLWLRGHGY
jgi:hypothetical protein